jgi:hypothetical protein
MSSLSRKVCGILYVRLHVMPLDKLPIKISAGFGLSMIDRAVKEFHAVRCTTAELTFMQRGRSTPDHERHCEGVESPKG